MKLCKYCKKPGKFDPILHKILCEGHRDIYLNFRGVWEAIADIQLNTRRGY